ncbi:MAG: hypothetical protein OXR62_01240 [Ahrensia sp.]|nr:hypothetical protein [Ahrensia sp.]
MKVLTSFPLMLLVLIAYNGLAFGLAGEVISWDSVLFSLSMISGVDLPVRLGEALLAFGLVILFFEVLKATRVGSASIVDHLFSTLVLLVFVVEFLLVPAASTTIFALLTLMVLIDVMAGFSVSIRSATRDVALDDSL